MLAAAQPAEPIDVEDLIRQGVELRRQGKDARALPLFEQAYRLAPTPRSAAQLGLVEMTLGYRLEAERHLHEALSAPHDIWVQRHRDQLEDSLHKVRSAIGELIVTGSPIGAEVRVNGNRVGELPLLAPIRLGEGPASVELRAPGYTSILQKISIMGSRRFSLQMDLRRAPAAPPARVQAGPTEVPAITTSERQQARGPDADVLLGVQVWTAGVKPRPEPSLAARVSGGYTLAALAGERLGLRLGAAAAISFINEDTGRVYFSSLLAMPGLRARLGQRVTGLADTRGGAGDRLGHPHRLGVAGTRGEHDRSAQRAGGAPRPWASPSRSRRRCRCWGQWGSSGTGTPIRCCARGRSVPLRHRRRAGLAPVGDSGQGNHQRGGRSPPSGGSGCQEAGASQIGLGAAMPGVVVPTEVQLQALGGSGGPGGSSAVRAAYIESRAASLAPAAVSNT